MVFIPSLLIYNLNHTCKIASIFKKKREKKSLFLIKFKASTHLFLCFFDYTIV